MNNWAGTEIFWLTLVNVFACLFLATLFGRPWAAAFPYKLKAPVSFYLAPVLGLASLTVAASLIGRFLPLGQTILVPLVVLAMFAAALLREKHKGQAFYHAFLISGFGVLCGLSLLVPLFVYGAYNPHNDTFTYLVHSDWLQGHPFSDTITKQTATSLTTQVVIYQQLGFRMGASFLLALIQALFNFKWAFEVYPGVVISALCSCCLALGFPIQSQLRAMARPLRLVLLAIPAFSLGGLSFAANLGFLPQTVGLAFAAALLFVCGFIYRWIVKNNPGNLSIAKVALPSALLFVAMTFAYSELLPFVVLGISFSGLVMAFRFRAWKNILLYGIVLMGCSILVLNSELLRIYSAMKVQSTAVVGGAVDWTPIGYLAHAFGVHGGAWDLFQWTRPEFYGSPQSIFGKALFISILVLILLRFRPLRAAIQDGSFLPLLIVLSIFGFTFVYFRYFVQSPFPTGLGQSWSQFKLSDWANPLALALLLFALIGLRAALPRLFDTTLVVLFLVCLMSTTYLSLIRIKPLMFYYSDVTNLHQFYLHLRAKVFAKCPPHSPVYLALQGEDYKFKQMANLFLYDREILSNWMDDATVLSVLPAEQQKVMVQPDNCVIEPIRQGDLLNKSTKVGPFHVGIFDKQGQVQISSVAGAYERERDRYNWWHWVEHKINFKLQPLPGSEKQKQTQLRFEYATRGPQNLTIYLFTHSGQSEKIELRTQGDINSLFEQRINLAPAELVEMTIETDGKATILGKNDPRIAAWIIRNVSINSA